MASEVQSFKTNIQKHEEEKQFEPQIIEKVVDKQIDSKKEDNKELIQKIEKANELYDDLDCCICLFER